MSSEADTFVLVTGGSGFVSLHIIAQSLAAGHKVRTTVRSQAKGDSVLKALKKASPPIDTSKLSFVVADLLKDEGWAEAVNGVSIVHHVASPFPLAHPKNETELIRPAVDGTLRVLKAAKASGTVKRVVVTSSVAAVQYGHKFQPGKKWTEADWSDPDGKGSPISPYAKSKTLAEKAAWDYIAKEGGDLELTVVNPAAIFGPPLLVPNESTSCSIVSQILSGKFPALPNISFYIIDVRDVASLHLLVASKPGAAGQRYLCIDEGASSLPGVAVMLKDGLGAKASKAPTRILPNAIVKVLSYVLSDFRIMVPELGDPKDMSNEKARALGWNPRPKQEAVVSMAQVLIDEGVC